MKKLAFLTICLLQVFFSPAQVGINSAGSPPDPSSGLDVDFNNKGFLLPRITTAQRDAISNPVEGLQIFNTSTKCLEYYVYGSWQALGCGCVTPVISGTTPAATCNSGSLILSATATIGIIQWYDAPTGGNLLYTGNSYTTPNISSTTIYYVDAVNGNCSTPSRTAISATINANPIVAAITGTATVNEGATTQLSNSTPGGTWLSSNTNLATVNSSGLVTGIAAGSPVISYTVTSNAGCSTSVSQTVTVNSPWSCGSNLTLTHTAGTIAPVSKTVTYGTISTNISGSTKCWILQNLGANNQASSVSDATEAAGGWFWQFNRKQGYKHDGSTLTPGWTITSMNENNNWLSSDDPCTLLLGSGWRIPTNSEWTTIESGWSTYTQGYSSALKLHAGGELGDNNGALYCRGGCGLYWTSTQSSNTAAYALDMGSGYSSIYNGNSKAYGFTVRCLKD